MTGITFDSIAGHYDAWCQTPLGALTERVESRLLDEMLPPDVSGMKVLDAGCGTGNWALHLAARGALVTGVDASPEMIAVARTKADAAAHRVDLLVGDAAHMLFPSGSFDLATVLLVLEFAPNPMGLLREVRRVVRPGGTVLIAALNRRSIWTMLRRMDSRKRPSIYQKAQFRTMAELQELVGGAGLEPDLGKAAVFYPPINRPWARPALELLETAGQSGFGIGPAYLALRAKRPAKEGD